MSKAKFTPGPWAWFGNTKHDFYLATTHSGRLYVMGFHRKGMSGAQPWFRGPKGHMVPASQMPIFEVCREAENAEDERVYRHDIVGFRSPDAHLIAAAPELYGALQTAEEALATIYGVHGDESAQEILREIQKALAKARGEG